MDTDRIVGSAKQAAGKAEDALGKAVGDRATAASGKAREAEGIIQNAFGQTKDAARDFADRTVDAGRAAYDGAGRLVADQLHERPGSSLLFAGLIGLALGYILAKGSQPARPRRVWDRYYP